MGRVADPVATAEHDRRAGNPKGGNKKHRHGNLLCLPLSRRKRFKPARGCVKIGAMAGNS